MGLFPDVKKINPETVGGYFDQGGYVEKIGSMSEDLMDPNSE